MEERVELACAGWVGDVMCGSVMNIGEFTASSEFGIKSIGAGRALRRERCVGCAIRPDEGLPELPQNSKLITTGFGGRGYVAAFRLVCR